MKCLYIIFIFLLSATQLFAVFEEIETSPRAEGMAEASVAYTTDVLGFIYNPANIVYIKNFQAISYYKKPFGLFQSFGAGALIPTSFGPFAFSIKYFGVKGEYRSNDSTLIEDNSELHREVAFSLTHAHSFSENFSAGASVNLYNLKQARFGQTYSLGINFGCVGKLYDRWYIGISGFNINSPKIGVETLEYLPRIIRAGLTFIPNNAMKSSFEFRHELGYPIRIAYGQEFSISEYLILRAGVQTEPVRFSGGITISFNGPSLDYSVIQHSSLPLTHIIAVGYSFK